LADAFLRVTRLGQAKNMLIPYDLVILMRTMFELEHVVRTLDPEFQLLETLRVKGPEVLKSAPEQEDWKGAVERLRHDTAAAMHDLPAVIGSWTRASPDREDCDAASELGTYRARLAPTRAMVMRRHLLLIGSAARMIL